MSLEFSYIAYNEDIVIVGKKSSGKTYLANEILRALTNVRIIVYDFQWAFHDTRGVVVHNIQEVFKLFDAGQKHIIFNHTTKAKRLLFSIAREFFSGLTWSH